MEPQIMAKEGPGIVFGVLLATRCDMLGFHVLAVLRGPNRIWRSAFEPAEAGESSTGAPGSVGTTEDSAHARFLMPRGRFCYLYFVTVFRDLKK